MKINYTAFIESPKYPSSSIIEGKAQHTKTSLPNTMQIKLIKRGCVMDWEAMMTAEVV